MVAWKEIFLTDMLSFLHECRVNSEPRPEIPTCVQGDAATYRTENDFTAEFFRERIVKTSVATDRIVWKDLWKEFEAWMKSSYGNVPKKMTVWNRFDALFGQKMVDYAWSGWVMPGNCSGGF